MNAVENQRIEVDNAAAGAALAAARTAQNLNVVDVARQLRLSVAQVEALETGDFDRLPGPVFVRGFIRNYARLLKLDPESVLRLIQPGPSAQQAYDNMPSSQNIPFPSQRARRWPKYALAAGVVMAGLAAYEFYWNEPATVTVSRPETPPAPVAKPAAPDAVQTNVNAPAAPNATPEPARPGEPAAQSTADAPDTSAAPQPAAQPQQEEGELHLIFAKESWVTIRDSAGRTVFARLNPGGTERRVRGKPPLKLIIGNAHGVRLTYNERPVDLERYIVKDDVARFTIE